MRGAPFSESDFSRGLNTIDSPYTLRQGEARECLNVNATPRGAIRKRFGSTAFGGSSITAEVLTLGQVTIGTTAYLLLTAGKNLYSLNAAGELSTIKEGLTEGKRWSIIQSTSSTEAGKPNKKIGGPVWLVNGTDKPLYWTGAAKNTEAKTWEGETGATYYEEAVSKEHVPNGKYMALAGNRIWMAGIAGDTSAVRFCDFSSLTEGGKQCDPTGWPKENVIRFDSSDSQPITGLGVVGPYVLVFKKHKTWVIYDLSEGSNRRISDTIGCVANRSIVETPNGTFFLTPFQGVYMTNGSTLHEMSYNVRPTFQKIKANQLENVSAGYFNNHYYISFAYEESATVNRTFDYDVHLQSWWLHDLAGNQWTAWEPEPGKLALYTIPPASKTGVVKTFVEGVYQDSGVNYTGGKGLTAYWISPWNPFWQYYMRHRFAQPNLKKRIRQIFFDGSGEIIPFIYKNFSGGYTQLPGTVDNKDMASPEKPVKFASAGGKWGSGEGKWGEPETEVWGSVAETGAARLYALGVARIWSLGFGNASKEPFEVDSFSYNVTFRKS